MNLTWSQEWCVTSSPLPTWAAWMQRASLILCIAEATQMSNGALGVAQGAVAALGALGAKGALGMAGAQ